MSKWRNDQDPDNAWGDQPPEPPRRSRQPRPERQPRRSEKDAWPEDVSPRVRALALDWMAQGEAVLGERPWVNLPAFAQRFSERIATSQEIQRAVGNHKAEPYTEEQLDRVNRLVSEMVRLFWDNLEVGEAEGSRSLLHVRFLRDYWDSLLERALLNLQAAWIRKHGVPVEPVRSASKAEVEARRLRQALAAAKRDVRPPVEPRNQKLQKPCSRRI